MKIRRALIAILVVPPLSFSTMAAEYQSIFSVHSMLNDDMDSLNSLSYSYFFKKLESKGPLDYFGFNQRVNQISLSTAFPEFDLFEDRNLGVNVSHNINNWQVGANYSKFESNTTNTSADFYVLSGQYFLTDNWGIGVTYNDGDYESAYRKFSLNNGFRVFSNYLINLAGDATLGFSVSYEDHTSDTLLSAEYFTPMANGGFLKASIALNENSDIVATGKYYFDQQTAVEMSLDEGDVANIGYNKFVSSDYKLSIGMSYPFEDYRLYNLGLTGYF